MDPWDLDHRFERLLVDTAVVPAPKEVTWINPKIKPGERRKVVTGIPGKTGIIYTLDRATGEFLVAPPPSCKMFAEDRSRDRRNHRQSRDDLSKSGRHPSRLSICEWRERISGGAYSPTTNAMYYGLQNTCMEATAVDNNSADQFISRLRMAAGMDKIGTIYAISAETRKTLWKL